MLDIDTETRVFADRHTTLLNTTGLPENFRQLALLTSQRRRAIWLHASLKCPSAQTGQLGPLALRASQEGATRSRQARPASHGQDTRRAGRLASTSCSRTDCVSCLRASMKAPTRALFSTCDPKSGRSTRQKHRRAGRPESTGSSAGASWRRSGGPSTAGGASARSRVWTPWSGRSGGTGTTGRDPGCSRPRRRTG